MKKYIGIGASILIACIPGAILPFFFWHLFDSNTSATARDILPPLDNPLEIIGFIGSIFFGLPVALLTIGVAQVLPSDLPSGILITIGTCIHVLLWSCVVELIRRLLNYFASSSSVLQDHDAKT